MSKKHWGLITASITFTLITLLIWAQAAQRNTIQILQNAGFEKPFSYDSHKSFGAVHLKNIILDADEASKIESLKSSFSFKNNATFLINGLDLTGDTLENKLSISGFDILNFPFIWPNLTLDKAIIKNARLALLTKNIGGLNINFDTLLARKNKQTLTLQTRLSSKQKKLTFGVQAMGTITHDQWIFNGTIEHFKITTPDMTLTRCHGTFENTQIKNNPITSEFEIQCGGAKIENRAWENLTATIKLNNNQWNGAFTASGNKNDTIINGNVTGTRMQPEITNISIK